MPETEDVVSPKEREVHAAYNWAMSDPGSSAHSSLPASSLEPPSLALRLLGAPGLWRGGEEVRLRPKKAFALLAYLVVEDRPHARDELAALFWPDLERPAARSNLRNLLWILRRELDGALCLEGDLVRLRPGTVASDLARFRACVKPSVGDPADSAPETAASLAEAARLTGGAFLEGLVLPGADALETWVQQQAETVRGELVVALSRLARLQRRQGDLVGAEATLRRLVREEPYDEDAHEILIELLAETGRRTAALRHFEAFEQTLRVELDVGPGASIRALADRVRSGDIVDRTHVSGLHETGSSGAPARPVRADVGRRLVGRDDEWRRMAAAHEPGDGAGRLLSLQGEAGIGKTSLAEAFLTHAQERGARVLACRCYEGEAGLAYGPLLDALERSLEAGALAAPLATLPEHALNEVARLLPAAGSSEARSVADGPGAQRRFFDAIARLVHALLAGTPRGVLFVDDLQWADTGTVELLAFLLRRLEQYPLTILIAWRDEDLAPDSPLPGLIAEIRRRGRAEVLRLGRLGTDHVGQLAARAGWPDAAAVRLYRETEGLPLLVAGYLGSSPLSEATRGGDAWALPVPAQEFLLSRFRGLDAEARSLLLAAATLARPADARLLSAVSGCGEDAAVATLERLVGRGLLVEERGAVADGHPGASYAFSHGKLRELVSEQAVSARFELFHRRAARALKDRLGADVAVGASQIAAHHRLGGEIAEAAVWHLRSARHAASVYAHAEALEHLRTALALGHPDSAEVHEQIGDLEVLRGRYVEALDAFAASERSDPGRRPRLRHKVGAVHARRGAWDEAEAAFAEARDGLGPERRSALLADWSFVALQVGREDEAFGLAGEALRDAEAPHDQARAHNHLGMLERRRGSWAEAKRHFDLALGLAGARDAVRVAAMNNLALLLARDGAVDQAESLSRDALELCRALGDRHHEAALHSNLADLLNARGELAAAMEHLKASAAIYAEIAREAEEWRPEVWMLSEW